MRSYVRCMKVDNKTRYLCKCKNVQFPSFSRMSAKSGYEAGYTKYYGSRFDNISYSTSEEEIKHLYRDWASSYDKVKATLKLNFCLVKPLRTRTNWWLLGPKQNKISFVANFRPASRKCAHPCKFLLMRQDFISTHYVPAGDVTTLATFRRS